MVSKAVFTVLFSIGIGSIANATPPSLSENIKTSLLSIFQKSISSPGNNIWDAGIPGFEFNNQEMVKSLAVSLSQLKVSPQVVSCIANLVENNLENTSLTVSNVGEAFVRANLNYKNMRNNSGPKIDAATYGQILENLANRQIQNGLAMQEALSKLNSLSNALANQCSTPSGQK